MKSTFVLMVLSARTLLNAAEALPPVQFCVPQPDGKHWNISYRFLDGSPCDERSYSQGLCDHVIYSCKQVTPKMMLQPLSAWLSDSHREKDCSGTPLLQTPFVVDQMAGEMRANRYVGEKFGPYHLCSLLAKPKAALVVFSGAGGVGWRDGSCLDGTGRCPGGGTSQNIGRDPNGWSLAGDNDYRALELYGIRVIAVKWETGLYKRRNFDSMGDAYGWLSRTSAFPSSVKELAKRPAAILKMIASRFVDQNIKFGIAGTSNGSNQSASIFWHNLGRRIDYLGLHAGGGLIADLNLQCGAITTNERIDKNTGLPCQDGDKCGPNAGRPDTIDQVKSFIDYIYQSHDCRDRVYNSAYLQSSYLDSSLLKPAIGVLDFLVNSDDSIQGRGKDEDLRIGVVWAAGKIRQHLTKHLGKDAAWANGRGTHGQVMQSGHPSFSLFKENVLRAFGL